MDRDQVDPEGMIGLDEVARAAKNIGYEPLRDDTGALRFVRPGWAAGEYLAPATGPAGRMLGAPVHPPHGR